MYVPIEKYNIPNSNKSIRTYVWAKELKQNTNRIDVHTLRWAKLVLVIPHVCDL